MADYELESDRLFSLDADEFETVSEFTSHLVNEITASSKSNLNIVLGVFDTTHESLVSEFRYHDWETVKDFGAVQRLHLHYDDNKRAEGYLATSDDNRYFTFYTTQAKTEEVDKGIDEILRNSQLMTYMYLPPNTLYDLASEINEDDKRNVVKFISKNPEETFNHYGLNGFERLKTFKNEFDALPYNIVVETDGLRFRVDTKGRFKLINGSLDGLLNWVDYCVNQSLEIRDAYESSDHQFFDITENDVTYDQIRISKPITIEYDELKYDDAVKFRNTFAESDRDYALLDYYAEEGSVYFSGTVYDPETNSSFRIRGDQDGLQILPVEDQKLKTIYKFVEFFQSSIKINASITF